MVTILLQQILDLLTGWLDSFTSWANDMGDKVAAIKTNTDNLPGIKADTADIKDNTAAVITPIGAINSNVSSIASDVGSIKIDTITIKNNAGSIATSSGTTAAFAEDIANNTLDCKNRLVTIGSDTTQIRTDSDNILIEQQKIYEGIKWLLSDKYIDMSVTDSSPVDFGTDSTAAIAITAGLIATQSGSGDPSPSNPRPITGYSSADLVVNGSNITISLGDTYYGGLLEFDKNGGRRLKVTHKIVDLATFPITSIIMSGAGTSAYARFYITDCADRTVSYDWLLSDKYNQVVINNSTTDVGVSLSSYSGMIYYRPDNITDYPTRELLLDYIVNTLQHLWVVYPLATPTYIDFTAGDPITSISGTNVISSNINGDITVDYNESIKYYLEHQN